MSNFDEHFVEKLLLLSLLLASFKRITSFPSGAPSDACTNLTPRHVAAKPKSGHHKYTIRANYYNFGDDSPARDGIKVRIEGPPFRGFLITAIDARNGQRIGKFAKLPGTSTIDACSAISHADRKSKKAATLLWLPPENGSGTVSFVATVVRSYSEYYTPITAEFEDKK